jgi:multidrug efflux pump subunit AcrB
MPSGLGPAGRLAQLFIDSKLTPLMMFAALAIGVAAIMLTPREEEPQIVVPMVDIFVGLPGATPEEVENRVTIPLEKAMWEIPGVDFVYSSSMPGVAMVTVRFYVGEDVERSLVKLYDKIAGNMDDRPPGATPPLIKQRSIDEVPVLGLTLWSSEYDHFELRRVTAELGKELARLDDVAQMELIGGQRRQIRVLLDSQQLASRGVDPAQLVQALQAQNANVPAGTYQERNREVVVETGAFLRSADEVRQLVVGAHRGRPVYLRDVARIIDGPAEADQYVFFAAGPAAEEKGIEISPEQGELLNAVTLTLAKRKGADANHVVQRALEKVEDLKQTLVPPEIGVTVTRNYGATSAQKAEELLTHLLVAIVSVTIVIGLFLGWRGGLVVFVSVPVTFALTLFVYYVFDYTLNRVTLFALIFVTGIVVDDSIIVVENIVRHFQMRKLPPLQAAINAVSEVGNPTILATLTVIAAVLPMAFVSGLMGPYMAPMPIGASLAMTFSLLVALIGAPWFSYRLMRGASGDEGEGYQLERTPIYRGYRWIVQPLLARPWKGLVFLGAVFVLLLASIALIPLKAVTVKMLPFDNKSEVQIIVDMPEGTTLEQTTRVGREMAGYLRTVPEVTDLELYAGTAAPINFNGLVRHYDLRSGANVADIQVNLVEKEARDDQSHAIAKRIRPGIQEIAKRFGAAAKVVEIPPGPPVLATLVAEVYGPTQEVRVELARKVKRIFEDTPGVVDVDWMVEAPQPKRTFVVDREKAALHGVAAGQVARALRLVLAGESAGVLHDDDEVEPVQIHLSLPRAERSSVEGLSSVRLASRSGALVPLSELIRVEETTEAISRHRKNLKPLVYVTGNVAGVEESPVYAILDMSEKIEEFETPHGGRVEQLYTDQPWADDLASLKWDGEWHITYEVFRDLGLAFAAVLVLIYMLIIGWFHSFKVPIVMMIAIPLSLVGILPGHWLFGAFFTATSMIGFIALAGIMVRNSVLLIDFINLSMEQGKTLGEAVIEAGAVRIRPILLTAGTVVVGAFVILFDPIFQGLAISLMSGAIASTVLTLIVVPMVHFLIERPRHEQPVPEEWR